MPVIRFLVSDLKELLGRPISDEALEEAIPRLGANIEDSSKEEWAVEFFPNRPDLYTVEGLARALRSFLGASAGPQRYSCLGPKVEVRVEGSVKEVRPFIVGGVVRGVQLGGRRLEGLIALQEDLHWGVGARRRKVAIGIHDLSPLSPPFFYRGVEPRSVRFVPLGGRREMDLEEILEEHEKGREFSHLVRGSPLYPLLVDSQGRVLSFPPIINGELTALTEKTQDVFIDVTGWDLESCRRALNLVATTLAERGGKIEGVVVRRGRRGKVYPDLSPDPWTLRIPLLEEYLGGGIRPSKAVRALRRMGHSARLGRGGKILVEVPSWRVDILHEVDLVEEVAVGLGLSEFRGELPRSPTVGIPLPTSRIVRMARWALVGQGFLETMGLSLSNPEDCFDRLRLPRRECVTVRNPRSESHTILRPSLLPTLLSVLESNVHRDLPQKVFEVGRVTLLEGESVRYERRVAAAWIAQRVGFTEVKGLYQAISRDLGLPAELRVADHPTFVPSRACEVVEKGKPVGIFGEIHPEVLSHFHLSHPAVALEITLG